MKGAALRERPCSRPSCPLFLLRPQGPLLTGTEPGEVVAQMDSRSPVLGYPGTVQLFKNRKIKVTIPKINWLMSIFSMFSKRTWVVWFVSVMKFTVYTGA